MLGRREKEASYTVPILYTNPHPITKETARINDYSQTEMLNLEVLLSMNLS